ncbi:Putative ribonuclease H protein At1g65750 [Linum perenne]
MQTSVLPATTCEAIDRRIRNFVWGSTTEDRKMHLVSWEHICKPKALGGLGLRQARQLNHAYMVKLAFIFMQKSDLLWVKVLQAKYFKETNAGLQLRNLASKSALWRGITKAWPDMLHGLRSGLRDGQNTSFWLGRWLDSGDRLLDLVISPTEHLDLEALVSSFVLESGESRGRGNDSWNWGEEPDGNFSIRSAYRLILELDNQTSDPDWKYFWRWRGPSRVQHFLWLAMHNKLLTNSERKRRHLTDFSSCPRCNVHEESVSHILRECNYATAVWNQLGLQEFCSTQENLCSWLSAGLLHQKSLIFGIGCWYLWKARNEWVFSAKPQSSADLAARISSWTHSVELALSQDSILRSKPTSRRNIDIVWDPGPEDWVTVNTDGSVINQSGNASAGGLIRDHLGHCFLAFSANIGKCSITRAELRGILQGLEFTWSSGYKKVRLQTDSQSAARLILAEDPPLHQHASEVLAIRELLHRNWQVEIQHIFREGNGATDFLANMGHGFRSWYSYGFLFRL